MSHHNLAESPLFDDDGLAALLDRTPREHVFALSMGDDLTRPDENRLAAHDHLSGAELLEAVKTGRLWLNVTGIQTHADEHSAVAHDLYGQLAAGIPGFEPTITTLTLLISSPSALVYYHVDGPANLLWHIRGDKRIWIYPPEESFVSQTDLEDIFAAVSHEYLPYTPDFDARAVAIDLEPGMVASWQPNSPHRVTNGESFNVSLSSEHYTPAQRRKARVYQANRMLRTRARCSMPNTSTLGVSATLKQAGYAAASRFGALPSIDKSRTPTLRVAPGAPGSVVPL